MKIFKALIVSILFLSTNVNAQTLVEPLSKSLTNKKTSVNLLEQDCQNGICGTNKVFNKKVNLRSIRVTNGRYSWIKRKIYFRTYRNRSYHIGFFLLSSNCKISSGIINLQNDIWSVGQYKYFTNSYTGRRLTCRVQKIVVN